MIDLKIWTTGFGSNNWRVADDGDGPLQDLTLGMRANRWPAIWNTDPAWLAPPMAAKAVHAVGGSSSFIGPARQDSQTISPPIGAAQSGSVSITGIDYRTSGASALTGVSVTAIQTDGYKFVGEYLGNSANSGYLTLSDSQQLGLPVVSIYERSPTTIGYFTASQADADAGAGSTASAITAAENVAHQPLGTVIYFTIDPAAEAGVYSGSGALPANYIAAIKTYFQRISDDIAAQGNPYKIGVYGPGDALNAVKSLNLQNVNYYWVDNHWGGTTFSGTANIRRNLNQVSASPNPIGVPVDTDTALTDDYGQWTPKSATPAVVVSIAESKIGTAWGDANCTGFVFSCSVWAGMPYFYKSGMVDGYNVDYLKEVGSNGAGRGDGGLLIDSGSTNDNGGFVTPVNEPTGVKAGGVFQANQLSGVTANPDPAYDAWHIVNGNASNFTTINNSIAADQPQPGDIFRGVIEEMGGVNLILHSGVVDSYDASTQTVYLISNWPLAPNGTKFAHHVTLVPFKLVSDYQNSTSSLERIITSKSTFYRLDSNGPVQVAGNLTASPGSGSFKSGSTISITLNTGSPVTISGATPVLNLNNGKAASFSSGSGTSILVFSYTVAAGDDVTALAVTGFSNRGANLTDTSGKAVSLPAISAVFSGLRIDTLAPTVSSPSLTVNTTAVATPIPIGSPIDGGGSVLSIVVTGLPTDGTVYLSDGVTSVSVSQSLTVDQLTGLTFKPTSSTSSQTSTFSYTVSDAASNSATGSVKLTVNASDAISGNLEGLNYIPAGTVKTISSPVYLNFANFGTPTNAILENAGTLIVNSNGSITGDGTAGGGVIGGNGTTGDTVVNGQSGTLYLNTSTTLGEMIPFENFGSLIVAPGTGNTAEITSYMGYAGGGAFNNHSTGTVYVVSGTFDIDRGGTSNASAFSVDAGATLLFTGAPSSPSFTFSGGTYSVEGTTEVGTGDQWGALTFAAGTTVNAANKWIINGPGPTDMSAATISGAFTNLQISSPSGHGGGNLIFGDQNVTMSGLVAYDGFTIQTTGAIVLTGTTSITDTYSTGSYASNFVAGTVNNYGVVNLTREDIGHIGVFNNYAVINIAGGGIDATTINNPVGSTISISGGGFFASTINNAGVLNLDGTTNWVSVTGQVINTGTITEAGTIYFQNGIVNSGTIIGSSSGNGSAITVGASSESSSNGRQVNESGTATVENTGVINASVGLVVDPLYTGTTTLIDSSLIVGTSGTAVLLGSGSDRLVLDPFASIIGLVNGGGGTNVIELTAGSGSGDLVGLGTNFVNFNTVIVDTGAIWQLSGTNSSLAQFTNNGTICVDGSALALGAVSSDTGQSGVINVSDGGNIEFHGAVDSSQSVKFGGNGGIVKLDDPDHFGGTISGLSSGDTIELNGNYSGGLSFGGSILANVQSITLDAGHNYGLTTYDANVAAGQTLTVDGAALGAADSLTFNGAAESNGRFVLNGGAGNDTLTGGSGNDTLRPGWGADAVYGRDGDDTISFTGGKLSAADIVDGGAGTDMVWLNGDYTGANAVTFNATTITNVETMGLAAGFSYSLKTVDATVAGGKSLTIDGSGLGASNTLTFDGSAETNGGFLVIGGAGADTLIGGNGPDTLSGRAGNDALRPGWGADFVYGGDGDDTISFTNGKLSASDVVDGGAGWDTVWLNGDYCGSNAVAFNAATITNVEAMGVAAGFNYDLKTVDATVAAGKSLSIDGSGLSAANTLSFNGSAETDGRFQIIGGAGADTLAGGSGNDSLSGLAGNDTLRPGMGTDVVLGGDGNDTISFANGKLAAADAVDGDAGNDMVFLIGDYSGANAVSFNASTMTNVETIALAAGFSYSLTTADATVAPGQSMLIDGSSLAAPKTLTFNGAAETNGWYMVIGGAGADTIYGGAGNDTLSGRAGNDVLRPGLGNDVASGGDGDDTISFTGGRLNAADVIDGGAGWDSVWLNGDYTGANAVTFTSTTMSNVEAIGFASSYSYNLKTSDATVAAGKMLTVDASTLGAANTIAFDGSAETNGNFTFVSGSGGDTFTGGTGADTFKYDAASRSTGIHYDTVNALNFATDSFDIPGSGGVVTGIDAAKMTGSLSTASFDTDLATALSALGAHHAILFTPNAGTLSGQTFLVIDCNGSAGYQASQDIVVRLNGYSGTLTVGAFH